MMGEPARFGNTLQLRERSRDVWGWNWLDALVRDLRFAARGLRRTPVFTLVATLSLALGFALTAVDRLGRQRLPASLAAIPGVGSSLPRPVRAARPLGARAA